MSTIFSCRIVCARRPFAFGDFHRKCTTDWLVGTGAQKYLEVVLGYWSKNSKLLLSTCLILSSRPCHLGDYPIQECDNDETLFLKHSCLEASKHIVLRLKTSDECPLITGGHLKSGQYFKVTVLPYYGTQEKGCDIILNLI